MIRRAAIRYRDFLRLPDVATMLVVALVTRMPIGTLSLSMLLHVRARAGSFAVAGAAVGAFMAAAAIVAPGVGRVVDRRGPRSILVVTGIVFSLTLAVLLAAEPLQLSNAAMIAAAAVAGVFSPPITVLTRTMWRYRFDDGIGEIGIIAPVSHPFCGHCSRIRITSDGKIRTCLFSVWDHDLHELMRRGAT